ncbi:MAG: hypothetical protein LBS05_08620 [Tannerellaceae bacterium]|jgi:hypothetical protein|nr:hypothetical protein [Tannerellaceae bacterium]
MKKVFFSLCTVLGIGLFHNLHTHEDGKYRIKKTFSTWRDYQPGAEIVESKSYDLSAEFILE